MKGHSSRSTHFLVLGILGISLRNETAGSVVMRQGFPRERTSLYPGTMPFGTVDRRHCFGQPTASFHKVDDISRNYTSSLTHKMINTIYSSSSQCRDTTLMIRTARDCFKLESDE
jgi:hypothetical protein